MRITADCGRLRCIMVDYGGLRQITVFYGILQHFMALYGILRFSTCFIMFYCVLLCFIAFYWRKSPKMTKNGLKLQMSMKARESSGKSMIAANVAEKSETGKVYCRSNKSKGYL